jgi:Pyruvate/2-oxoacid:ferredoxin oxidoreductase gamma subunit
MNDKVKLKSSAGVKEYDFAHALEIMRIDKYNDYEAVGNHEFINNELIIKPSTNDSAESDKPSKGKKGRKVRKSSKDTDAGV